MRNPGYTTLLALLKPKVDVRPLTWLCSLCVVHRTKALLLSTYVKFENLYPECRDLVAPVFDKYSPSTELELQQRAVEYLHLAAAGDDILETVLAGGHMYKMDE
jgi:hypothetical protein